MSDVNTDELVSRVRGSELMFRVSFYAWSIILYSMSLAIIVLPLLISSGLFDAFMTKIFALTTAICAAISSWSNLPQVVGNFRAAFNILNEASVTYAVNKNSESLLKSYLEARKLVISWSPGLPNTKS